MNSKRKNAENDILTYVDMIAKGGQNKKLYQDLFKSMPDSSFDKFMRDVRDKKITLGVIVPLDGSVKVTVKNNYKVADKLGYSFFQHLTFIDPDTKEPYSTPNKYLVYRLPVRRTAQLLSKAISIAKDSKHIDSLTGQVSGVSKAATITMPEIQLLVGMGLNKTLVELLNSRGGDAGAKNALVNGLYKNGKIDLNTLEQYSTGVESTKTLKTYFTSAHIKTTGLGK